jgi:hypothetical protein
MFPVCSALLEVKAHGEDAAIVAAQRADALLVEGDVEGHRVFIAIMKAVEKLRRAAPNEGEKVRR